MGEPGKFLFRTGLFHSVAFPLLITWLGAEDDVLLGRGPLQRGLWNTAGFWGTPHPLAAKGTLQERREGFILAFWHALGACLMAMGPLISDYTRRRIPIPKTACYVLIGSGIGLQYIAPIGPMGMFSVLGLNMLLNYSEYEQTGKKD